MNHPTPASLTLDALNACSQPAFVSALQGIYEYSPWVAEAAFGQRQKQGPFKSLAQLKQVLVQVVRAAPHAQQLALIQAHPELAGKAMVAGNLTEESTGEQGRAGLTHCSPQEFEQLQKLNADYNAKFGFPFILAVRGPRGLGLSRQEIIATFQRRLAHPRDVEFAECLRQIDRIAEIRLNDRFNEHPHKGEQVWDWAEQLAAHSEPAYACKGELTVTYLTAAHLACAQQLQSWMHECGFDEVRIDAVGNVVGRYRAARATQTTPTLLTGSHYDTVRNGGKYDGRLGILVPMQCVKDLHQRGERLPFHLEVVGFAEEEGQRYKATFLGSCALTGQFDPTWLSQQDSEGITMAQAMKAAGLSADLQLIAQEKRDPKAYLGFIEVHIEQGPVLHELNQPLGIVTSINGSVRYQAEVIGMASHAGTTPMDRRKDAALAVAELALYMEQRALKDGDSVATVGMWEVPQGSINVVPGRCRFSMDMRAPHNAQRDQLAQDVLGELQRICDRRGLSFSVEEVMKAAAAPSAAAWQTHWEHAVAQIGLTLHRLPSGAGHDAMKLHEIMPQAMLFCRGGNAGISHNPLETITSDDADLCVQAFAHVLQQLKHEMN